MHSVIETPVFTRRADALLSREDRAEIISRLSADPLAGVVMPGGGGIRKLRFAPKGRGKSGAYRVIYYVLTDDLPLVAITIYGKNEQSDISQAELRGAKAIVDAMKMELKRLRAAG